MGRGDSRGGRDELRQYLERDSGSPGNCGAGHQADQEPWIHSAGWSPSPLAPTLRIN